MPIMSSKFIAIALLALTTSVAALANDAPSAAPQAQAAAASAAPVTVDGDDADHKVICKREAQVGTLIPNHVCKTAAQWQLERDASRKMVQDLQQHTGTTGGH
jgi:hypothetical protein